MVNVTVVMVMVVRGDGVGRAGDGIGGASVLSAGVSDNCVCIPKYKDAGSKPVGTPYNK